MPARNRPDLAAGLLLVAVAGFAFYFLMPLPFGTPERPGAGFVPLSLALILAALGAVIALRGFAGPPAAIEPGRLRPVAAVSAGIACFAALVESAGLPAAVFAAVLASAAARRGSLDWRSVAFALLLAVFCTVAFKYGLKLPFKLVP